MADSWRLATIRSSNALGGLSWLTISLTSGTHVYGVKYSLRASFPGIRPSKQSIQCRNCFLPGRQHFAEFLLSLFQFGLLCFARFNEFCQRCFNLSFRRFRIDCLLQGFSFRTGSPEHTTTAALAFRLISLVISTPAAWPTEHSASHACHAGHPGLHYLLDQRLHGLPFRIISDLHLLVYAFHSTLLKLGGVKVAPSWRPAGIVLRVTLR